jgi:magnesium transporter
LLPTAFVTPSTAFFLKIRPGAGLASGKRRQNREIAIKVQAGQSRQVAMENPFCQINAMNEKQKSPVERKLDAVHSTDPQDNSPVNARNSEIQLIAFGNGLHTELELVDISQARDCRSQYPVVWINVNGYTNTRMIEAIGHEFGLHPLALEDAVNQRQVAKCEDYTNHIFFVSRILNAGDDPESEQFNMFIGQGFLITFQEFAGDCFDPVRERIRSRHGKVANGTADFLAYTILDILIDSYFPLLDALGDRLDDVESQVGTGGAKRTIKAIHDCRNRLLVTRRAIRPLRDAISQLMRAPSELIREETKVFLRDCFDHTIQLTELLETQRELCTDVRDFHVSMITYRMNEIMKVLTIIATIFIPLSFIASVYGMNFRADESRPLNMPELEWEYGYLFALGLMALTALGFLAYFWRKGWLEFDRDPGENDLEERR